MTTAYQETVKLTSKYGAECCQLSVRNKKKVEMDVLSRASRLPRLENKFNEEIRRREYVEFTRLTGLKSDSLYGTDT